MLSLITNRKKTMIQNSFFEEKMLYKKCSIKHRSDGRYSCDVRIAFDDVSKNTSTKPYMEWIKTMS